MQPIVKLIAGGIIVWAAAWAPLALGVADDASPSADIPPADPHHPWMQPWHERHELPMFRELGLTSKQRQDMRGIVEAARPAMRTLRDQLRANEQTLRQTTPDDRNYAAVVAKVSQDNGALTAQLISQRAKVFSQCYALLAPIQKTRLAELQAEHAAWREHHPHGEHPQAGDGGEAQSWHPHGGWHGPRPADEAG